jgi:hypothetical protein
MINTSPHWGCREAMWSNTLRIIKAKGRGMIFKVLAQRGKPQKRETPWIFSTCRYLWARVIIDK